ncbi:hypothetical protein ACVBEF_11830 [Glaciimonas sp. GG7]
MQAKNTIDTAIAKRMVEACAISAASIIGQPGGWSVMLTVGAQEKPLGVQRSDKPRLWKSLDRCVEYLKTELHIARFNMLDSTDFSSAPMSGNSKNKAAERMRNAHEAAAYDKWFRAEIEDAIKEADDPNTIWVTDEEAQASWEKQRAALVKRAKGSAV